MNITPSTHVADIATAAPGTIKVFQKHRIDFCCGGKLPLADVCQRHQLDVQQIIAELDGSLVTAEAGTDWAKAPLTDLVAHIQRRYHRPLTEELPRLRAMLDKVVSRHGTRLPETLLPLQEVFAELQSELLAHMTKEDLVLFPAIVALEAGEPPRASMEWRWIDQPIAAMEAEHAYAGAALERIADLTDGYVPPEDACPTFRGLYHGLGELEREMHQHVHLENHILFPRAAALARRVAVP
jgi:regulator of cell morphogenesis and NO signaling